jgi:hypothetical protein
MNNTMDPNVSVEMLNTRRRLRVHVGYEWTAPDIRLPRGIPCTEELYFREQLF